VPASIPPLRRAAWLGSAFLATGLSWGQTAPPAQDAPAPAEPQRVEITGGRQTDTEQRRQSTAAKIVVGREEIERFGDSTLSEVLKRLPGVTMSGPPGRGGGPRMRGLGAGYTQILLDGQRIPPGFSLDSINPDQIERIEILRAPTAETGARAIGGTINIVTREGFTKRMNDLRIGTQLQRGRASPGLSWTRNGGEGAFSYNVSASGFHASDLATSSTTTTVHLPCDGPFRVEVCQWIAAHVLIRVYPTGEPNGITLGVSPDRRVVVAIPVLP